MAKNTKVATGPILRAARIYIHPTSMAGALLGLPDTLKGLNIEYVPNADMPVTMAVACDADGVPVAVVELAL